MIQEQTLHGLVVGLGVQHKDGSKDFKWLDKPIHNRIVSCGLDAFFQYNGSNTALINVSSTNDTIYNYGNRFLGARNRTMGLLAYFGIGTGGSPTNFSTTTPLT